MPHDETRAAASLGSALSGYGLLTWLWVVGLSLAGGCASFFRKLKAGNVRPFNVTEFVGEVFISGFAGVCTFLLCEAAGFDPLMTSPLVAISGHMGGRAIFQLEQFFTRKVIPND